MRFVVQVALIGALALVAATRSAEAAPSATTGKAAPAEPAVADSWARQGAIELLRRAQHRERDGRLTEALEIAMRAAQIDSRFGEAWMYVAELRERMRDFAEADRVYARAARVRPVAAEALARRASLRRRTGHADQALADIQRSLHLEPDHADRWRLLAVWYTERRSWAAALGAWRRVRSLIDHENDASLREARVKIMALTLLAAETDPVAAGATAEHNWVRRSLSRVASR